MLYSVNALNNIKSSKQPYIRRRDNIFVFSNSNKAYSENFLTKEKKSGKNIWKKIIKDAAIAAGITIGTIGTDLFLCRGKFFSAITGNKVSFISGMEEDIQTILRKDPSVNGKMEIVLCYPGLHAIWMHRIAHKLYRWKIPVLPRLIQNISRMVTGIEIHPGVKLGRRLVIDHTGAVIGETTEIGNDVVIIGRTVLGATGKEKGLRHPIIEDNVLICMNTSILGRIKIGKNSKIGAGTVVLNDVQEGSTVVGKPGEEVRIYGRKIEKG